MFCRFCGKNLPSQSDFCAFCGQPLAPNAEEITIAPAQINKEHAGKKSALPKSASIIFGLGIVGFAAAYIKIAPGYGGYKFLAYLIGMVVMLAISIVLGTQASKRNSRGLHWTKLVYGLILLLGCASLLIVYETKVDAALSDVADSGYVHVLLISDDKFYSESESGIINDPQTVITYDSKRVSDSDIYVLELNKDIAFQASTSYVLWGQKYSGSGTKTVQLTSQNLREKDGYSFDITFDTGGDHWCVVTITAKYRLSFWEVLLH